MLKQTYAFKDFIQNGLGADLVRLTGLKNMCEQSNTMLYICNYDNWCNVPNDASLRNWAYYFEPTIPLDTNDEYPHITEEQVKKCLTTIVPEQLEYSKFEYRSKLMQEIYVPKKEYIENVKKYIHHNLSFLEEKDYVVIHIRRGDKTSGPWREGDEIGIEQYISALEKYIFDNKISSIIAYILTDSDKVIHEIKQYEKKNQKSIITFAWDNNETRRDGYCYKLYKYGYSNLDIRDEIFTFMKNIYIMQNAMEIIGSRMSFFFITAELLRGKKGINLSNNKYYPVDFYD